MTERGPDDEKVPLLAQAEHFEPLVGRDVRFGDAGPTLVLASVDRDRGTVPAGAPRAPFSLIFSGSSGETHLPEGTYRCDFGGGAAFEIHVAPIHTPSAARQDYQAVFN